MIGALLAGTIASLTFALGEVRQRNVALEQADQADAARQAAVRESYLAHLGAAVANLVEREFTEAAFHLEAAPSSLRGWEWRHLHRRLLDETPTVTRLPKDCGDVQALFPDGRHLLTRVLDGGEFRLFDTVTGVLQHEIAAG